MGRAIAVITRRLRGWRKPLAVDCVSVLVVREGSLVVHDQRPPQHAPAGTALMIAPGVAINYEAEGSATVTTLLIDTDYLIEHLFW